MCKVQSAYIPIPIESGDDGEIDILGVNNPVEEENRVQEEAESYQRTGDIVVFLCVAVLMLCVVVGMPCSCSLYSSHDTETGDGNKLFKGLRLASDPHKQAHHRRPEDLVLPADVQFILFDSEDVHSTDSNSSDEESPSMDDKKQDEHDPIRFSSEGDSSTGRKSDETYFEEASNHFIAFDSTTRPANSDAGMIVLKDSSPSVTNTEVGRTSNTVLETVTYPSLWSSEEDSSASSIGENPSDNLVEDSYDAISMAGTPPQEERTEIAKPVLNRRNIIHPMTK